jgi:hypothetical protein
MRRSTGSGRITDVLYGGLLSDAQLESVIHAPEAQGLELPRADDVALGDQPVGFRHEARAAASSGCRAAGAAPAGGGTAIQALVCAAITATGKGATI